MDNQSVLALIGPDCTAEQLGPLMERAREVSAHLAMMVVGASPPFPAASYGSPHYGVIAVSDVWQEQYAEGGEALKQKGEEIEALLETHGASGDVSTVYCEPPAMDDAVGRRAKICDLAYVGPDLRAAPAVFDHALRGVLFASPIGAVINGMAPNGSFLPRNVFLAWNTSLPSARAVHAALPTLLAAEQVTVACFDPVMTELRDGENPGSDLAKWLSHHGCTVTVQQYPSGGKEIGACIQDRAQETGADLIVMGAYGHARMREAVFGGTTRSMIQQTGLPVLMAH